MKRAAASIVIAAALIALSACDHARGLEGSSWRIPAYPNFDKMQSGDVVSVGFSGDHTLDVTYLKDDMETMSIAGGVHFQLAEQKFTYMVDPARHLIYLDRGLESHTTFRYAQPQDDELTITTVSGNVTTLERQKS